MWITPIAQNGYYFGSIKSLLPNSSLTSGNFIDNKLNCRLFLFKKLTLLPKNTLYLKIYTMSLFLGDTLHLQNGGAFKVMWLTEILYV